jgi:hypothetical protein
MAMGLRDEAIQAAQLRQEQIRREEQLLQQNLEKVAWDKKEGATSAVTGWAQRAGVSITKLSITRIGLNLELTWYVDEYYFRTTYKNSDAASYVYMLHNGSWYQANDMADIGQVFNGDGKPAPSE